MLLPRSRTSKEASKVPPERWFGVTKWKTIGSATISLSCSRFTMPMIVLPLGEVKPYRLVHPPDPPRPRFEESSKYFGLPHSNKITKLPPTFFLPQHIIHLRRSTTLRFFQRLDLLFYFLSFILATRHAWSGLTIFEIFTGNSSHGHKFARSLEPCASIVDRYVCFCFFLIVSLSLGKGGLFLSFNSTPVNC